MELSLVKSSNISAVGYLQFDRVILVRYRDGSLYARLEATPEQFVGLMAAESKGAFVAQLPNPTVRIRTQSPGKEGAEDSQSKPPAPAAVPSSGTAPAADTVTNVLDVEASACCQNAFHRGPPAFFDVLVCPDCGSRFEPEMVGAVRYWRFSPTVAIGRPR